MLKAKIATLMLLLFFLVFAHAQGREHTPEYVSALLEQRLKDISAITSTWEKVIEVAPDPNLNWKEIAEQHVRTLGSMSPEAIEEARRTFEKVFREIALGYKQKERITLEGCGNLILATTVQDKPFLVVKVFFLPREQGFFNYMYGQPRVKPYAAVQPMGEVDSVFGNLLVRWFFLGGDLIKWGNFRVLEIEPKGDLITLRLADESYEQTPPQYRQVLEVKISKKYGGAPISVLSKYGQKVGSHLKGVNFRRIAGVWLPTLITDKTPRYKGTYRLISAERQKDPSSVIMQMPKGIVVNDLRLGRDKQVNYRFQGRLPTLEELERMWKVREKELQQIRIQSTLDVILRWLLPIFLITVGLFWYLRVRRG